METSQIGAELAELDLKLRGPGELYGTQQSGVKQLKIASFSDFPLIQKARDAARAYLPQLSKYPHLKEQVMALTQQKVSPD
jgi:RecG-like helicase